MISVGGGIGYCGTSRGSRPLEPPKSDSVNATIELREICASVAAQLCGLNRYERFQGNMVGQWLVPLPHSKVVASSVLIRSSHGFHWSVCVLSRYSASIN